jgi:hypothetical protein
LITAASSPLDAEPARLEPEEVCERTFPNILDPAEIALAGALVVEAPPPKLNIDLPLRGAAVPLLPPLVLLLVPEPNGPRKELLEE